MTSRRDRPRFFSPAVSCSPVLLFKSFLPVYCRLDFLKVIAHSMLEFSIMRRPGDWAWAANQSSFLYTAHWAKDWDAGCRPPTI